MIEQRASPRSAAARARRRWVNDIRGVTVALALLLTVIVWGLIAVLLRMHGDELERGAAREAETSARLTAADIDSRLVAIEAWARQRGAPAPAEVQGHRDAGSQAAPAGAVTRLGRGRLGMTVTDAAGTALLVEIDAARLLLAAGASMSDGDVLRLLGAADGSWAVRATGDDTAGDWPALLSNARAGAALQAEDGAERRWAASSLDRRGIVVAAGTSLAGARAAQRQRAQLLIVAATLETVVAIALAVIANRQARRLAVLLLRLDLSRRRLRAASRAKTHFLENISHELRTPLNGILPSSELLVQLARSDEQAELSDMVNQSAVELAKMIDMLIDVADLQAGRSRLAMEPSDVRPVVERASAGHATVVRSRGGRLEVAFDTGLPSALWCDRSRLARVVDALIDAASRDRWALHLGLRVALASPDRLRLALEARPAGPDAADDAAGVQAARGAPAGPGADGRDLKAALGLLMVEDLLSAMGGRLEVISAGGATFRLDAWVPVGEVREEASA